MAILGGKKVRPFRGRIFAHVSFYHSSHWPEEDGNDSK